jgi:sulfur transfer protein SufE
MKVDVKKALVVTGKVIAIAGAAALVVKGLLTIVDTISPEKKPAEILEFKSENSEEEEK